MKMNSGFTPRFLSGSRPMCHSLFFNISSSFLLSYFFADFLTLWPFNFSSLYMYYFSIFKTHFQCFLDRWLFFIYIFLLSTHTKHQKNRIGGWIILFFFQITFYTHIAVLANTFEIAAVKQLWHQSWPASGWSLSRSLLSDWT